MKNPKQNIDKPNLKIYKSTSSPNWFGSRIQGQFNMRKIY